MGSGGWAGCGVLGAAGVGAVGAGWCAVAWSVAVGEGAVAGVAVVVVGAGAVAGAVAVAVAVADAVAGAVVVDMGVAMGVGCVVGGAGAVDVAGGMLLKKAWWAAVIEGGVDLVSGRLAAMWVLRGWMGWGHPSHPPGEGAWAVPVPVSGAGPGACGAWLLLPGWGPGLPLLGWNGMVASVLSMDLITCGGRAGGFLG